MYKKIEIKGKDVDFKCSAATSILYKRLFGKSLSAEVTEMANESAKAYKMLEQLNKLQENKNENTEAILNLLADNPSLVSVTEKTEKIGPQMAYIMWLEANKPQRELFQCLTEDAYISWLSDFDKGDMTNVYSELLNFWNGTNKSYSNPKNQ
ncbi:MAG: hypothetical protein J6112_02770 [Clostridia bacterium]|nr:hypothetical protein [Clostridia bacterium]